ncbi:MAG: heme-binding protein [Flavobacteriia bacterium]|nr:heme-binding protein [Flavobacteriia bacterium]
MKGMFTKCLLVLGIVILVLFGIYSFYMGKIEKPTYTVESVLDEGIEIRVYDTMIVAKTELAGASFDTYGSQGFRNVASYIFGNNQSQTKIAMTSPVVMEQGAQSSMYFVMPKQYTKDALPTPNSNRVEIVELKPKRLAVIRFGGWANDQRILKYQQRLKRVLDDAKLPFKAPFIFMAYNAPWDIFARRNEVAVEL